MDFGDQGSFHPVIKFPPHYIVLDLSKSDALMKIGDQKEPFTIGKFNEARPYLYQQNLFIGGSKDPRNIHMGIDLGAPAWSPVYSFDSGILIAQGQLPDEGDYGHSIVVEYTWRLDQPLVAQSMERRRGETYWALYGHLSASSLNQHRVGDHIKIGEQLGFLGDSKENGGWAPHLHFQLSMERPIGHDLPGAVSENDRSSSLELYPDPRQVLGPLY